MQVLGALPLSLRQLQYVVAVADAGSFRAAARACAVSQPALSMQLAELESALGVRIFERTSRSVRVSAAGAPIVDRARRVLREVDELQETARAAHDPFARTLTLGVIPTIAPYLLASLAPRVARAHPRLDVRFSEDKTARLVAAVEEGTLDGALLALEADLGGLAAIPIAEDSFVFACAPSHPLATRTESINVDDVSATELLLLDEGHCLRDQIVSFCRPRRASELPFRATSLSTLVPMVASGGRATLLPAIAVDVENRRGDLVVRAIFGGRLVRTLGIVHRKESASRDVLAAIAAHARDHLREAA